MFPSKPFLFTALLVVTIFAGCVGSDADLPDPRGPTAPFVTTFHVTDVDNGEAVPFARITILDQETPVLITSTDHNGTADVLVPPNVTGYAVTADGYRPHGSNGITDTLRTEVALAPAGDEEAAIGPGLAFRDAVDLGSYSYPLAFGTNCDDLLEDRDGDCGLGEPSVEVDALGNIYVTGVCCITGAPPVYVSRDGGDVFELLETPHGIREAFGIEGDFAIDDEGVIYYADIELAATFQLTAWDKDGEFLHHAKWPAPPLVDRDWIRAEGDGHLYYVYNTGTSTLVYTSTDRGVTWSPGPVHDTGYGLGSAIKGPDLGELWVVGGGDSFRNADVTRDGGATWDRETTTLPRGGMDPGYFDEGGNLYLTSSSDDEVHVARRDPDGAWHDAWVVSPPHGHHRMPWIAAGAEGKVAVAWYGTLDEEITPDSEWHLYVALSLDAQNDTPHWQSVVADPEPILTGNLQRQLLDFFQLVIGPDNAVHIAYSRLGPDDGTEERLHYVRSEAAYPISPQTYFWGPK